MTLTSGTEEMGTLTGAVIAHEALGFDAEGGEVSQGALEEEDGAMLSFIGHNLNKGRPGSIMDCRHGHISTQRRGPGRVDRG